MYNHGEFQMHNNIKHSIRPLPPGYSRFLLLKFFFIGLLFSCILEYAISDHFPGNKKLMANKVPQEIQFVST